MANCPSCDVGNVHETDAEFCVDEPHKVHTHFRCDHCGAESPPQEPSFSPENRTEIGRFRDQDWFYDWDNADNYAKANSIEAWLTKYSAWAHSERKRKEAEYERKYGG